MALYEQEFLRPGSYELGGGAIRTLTQQDLARLQANTQALLTTGYVIPVLLRHPTAGSTAGGPRLSPAAESPAASIANAEQATEQAAEQIAEASAEADPFPQPLGRLVAVRQSESGTLIHQLELPYEDEAELVEGVGLRYTSPEIRESFLDATGQERGPIIAHLALTSRPRVADQPPLALAAGAVRLSLRDLQSPVEEPRLEDIPTAAEEPPLEPPPAGEAALGPEDLVAIGAQVAGEQAAALASDQQRRYRQELAERIRQSRRLPLGLRERLAATVGAVQLSREGDEEPSLRLSEAVALLEESLPEHLALTGGRSTLAAHPAGERFFTGDRGPLSDDEATRIAREQLHTTGFARRE